MARLAEIYRGIRDVRIQGATSIARAALNAYMLKPTKATKKKLLSLRPTEPMLTNTLHFIDVWPKEKVIGHFNEAQNKINKEVINIIKNNYIIATHCHSTNVVKALIYAKKKGKKFEIYNTEARPLYQGRKTAKELTKVKIKVTSFVDSAIEEVIAKCDIVLLGADAILRDGIINKVGSGMIAELAKLHKKPLYIVADSWKFSSVKLKLEERDFHEMWKYAPKDIKIRNPAFEKVDKKFITAIISEYGLLNYGSFIKRVQKEF